MTSLRPRVWVLASALGGILVGTGFLPWHLWPLVPVGVAVLVLSASNLHARTAFFAGLVFGLGFFGVLIHWVTIALNFAVFAVFSVVMAMWYALIGLIISLTRRVRGGLLIGLATWMVAEWCSARWPFGGFGWGRLAYAAVDTPIDGFFPLISATGVSFLIAASGFALAWMLIPWTRPSAQRGWKRVRPASVATVAALVFCSGTGVAIAKTPTEAIDGSAVSVGIVQGNLPGAGIDSLGPRYTTENNHLAEMIILAAQVRTGVAEQPDFVVFPENSTATDPFQDTKTHLIIDTAVDLAGVPILVGSITRGPGEEERQTVGLWWTEDGVVARYAKRNLVPFGEWIPWRDFLLPIIPILEYIGAQSVPGTTPGVLNVDVGSENIRVGDTICFEISYDSTFDEMVKGDATTGGGAHVLIVQTSNSMFTNTVQMVQQDAITRVRAMESGREILVATTNSLSGLIDGTGDIVYESQLRTSDAQVFTVPLRTGLTTAIRFRAVFDVTAVAFPLVAWIVAFVAGRIRQRKNESVQEKEGGHESR